MTVAIKAINANDIQNGNVVTGVDKQGNKHTLAPPVYENTSLGLVNALYDSRFDDPRYYTGDAVT